MSADGRPSSCPRCHEGALELDPTDGFVICTSCGFVADDTCLDMQQEGGGTAVDGPNGAPYGAGQSEVFRRGVGSVYDKERDSAYRIRKQVDHMEGVGSTLKLPAAVIEEAGHLLREYKAAPKLPGAPRAWAVLPAGVLYLAARRAGLGLVLPQVADAVTADPWTVGAAYRHVCRTLGLTPPLANLRSLVIRHASELIPRRYGGYGANTGTVTDVTDNGRPGGAAQQGRQQAVAAGGALVATGAGARAGAARQGAGEEPVPIHRHPFMRTSVQLAELLSQAGIGEGRPIKNLAAGVLQLATEVHPPPGSKHRRKHHQHADLLEIVGVHKSVASETRTALVAGLLELAQKLPFASTVDDDNVLSYLPILSSLAGTLETIRQAAPPRRAPVPAATGIAATGNAAIGTAAAAPSTVPPAGPCGLQQPSLLGKRGLGVYGAAYPGMLQQQEQQRRRLGRQGAPAWRALDDATLPVEGEEDDARVALGLMTMDEVRRERAREAEARAGGGDAEGAAAMAGN